MSNELTTKAGNELANINPELAALIGETPAESDFSGDDLAIPRIRILQTLSKEMKENRPEYIEGAKVGDIFNSVTKKVTEGSKGIIVFYCAFRMCYVEWDDRKFVACHDKAKGLQLMETTTKNEKNENILPNGFRLVKTAEYAVVIYDEETGDMQQAIINMSGMKLKKSTQWNTAVDSMKINGQKAAQWVKSFKFTTIFEDNDKGDWYNYVIEPHKLINEYENAVEIFKFCKETRDSYLGQKLKIEAIDEEFVLNDDAPDKEL